MTILYQAFPVLTLEGDAYECGLQHGAGAAQRVAKTLEIYLSAFDRQAGLALEDVRERARRFAGEIESLDPDSMAELRGIADGARQHVEDIIAVNCRTERLFGSLAGVSPPASARRSSRRTISSRCCATSSGAPRAICRSPHDYPGQTPTMTIASLLFDPVAGTMEVAPGQPTHSEYQKILLPAAARLEAVSA